MNCASRTARREGTTERPSMHGSEGAHVAEVGGMPTAEVCAGEVATAEMHVAAAMSTTMSTTMAAAVTTAASGQCAPAR
jgi:hypothetical protein